MDGQSTTGTSPANRRSRLPVAILGATGTVGQRLITLLHDDPWFRIASLMASSRSLGRPYADAVRWVQSCPLPADIGETVLAPAEPSDDLPRLVFSALDAAAAEELEPAFARRGHTVISNARNYRMHDGVPLIVPEVNPDHLAILERGAFAPGAIVTNPNCSTIGIALSLKPLHDAFGIEAASVVTLQAISGAGLPGVSGLEITDNVVPFIAGEEDKIEHETSRILGTIEHGRVRHAPIRISAQCNRVPVVDGHLACVSVKLSRPARTEDLIAAWTSFSGEPQRAKLPTAPAQPIVYLHEADAPQPRLHRDLGHGMSVTVGRLRPCPILDFKFVVLSHNTIRGAAGGTLLVAELAVNRHLPGLQW